MLILLLSAAATATITFPDTATVSVVTAFVIDLISVSTETTLVQPEQLLLVVQLVDRTADRLAKLAGHSLPVVCQHVETTTTNSLR